MAKDTPLLSAQEIVHSIESVLPVTDLGAKIRSGEWLLQELEAISKQIDLDISKKLSKNEFNPSVYYRDILVLITIIFYSKDRFGYDRQSKEFKSLEHLFGRLMAALGV